MDQKNVEAFLDSDITVGNVVQGKQLKSKDIFYGVVSAIKADNNGVRISGIKFNGKRFVRNADSLKKFRNNLAECFDAEATDDVHPLAL